MGKNDFLARTRAREQAVFSVGENIGMQRMWDYLQIALNSTEVMGKDTLGKSRLKRAFDFVQKLDKEFQPAFNGNEVESDVCQRNMDAALEQIWGDELAPFYDRYPDMKKIDYSTRKKSWT